VLLSFTDVIGNLKDCLEERSLAKPCTGRVVLHVRVGLKCGVRMG